jgi:hypothetical protein
MSAITRLQSCSVQGQAAGKLGSEVEILCLVHSLATQGAMHWTISSAFPLMWNRPTGAVAVIDDKPVPDVEEHVGVHPPVEVVHAVDVRLLVSDQGGDSCRVTNRMPSSILMLSIK